MIYLCLKCDKCKVYRYQRSIKGTPFKFLYCAGNKHIVDKYDWFPETHCAGRTSYVRCTKPNEFGHNRLHTYWTKKGYILDHINRRGLDDRMRNWRLLTPRENSQNRSDNTKYPGVFKEGKGYITRIKIKGKYYRIGKKVSDPKQAYARYLKTLEVLDLK
ncbi:MAG: hypothetical protein K8E24_014480 [Methanobacterium paludis]|nr:hypothetical protein [Methanobacterium paludis]